MTYTRSHLSDSVENSIQDDEERKDGEKRVEGTADDESHNGPQNEAKRHGLLASNLVHEKATKKAARQVETVEQRSVAHGLNKTVTGVECGQNCRAEKAKRICLSRSGNAQVVLESVLLTTKS